MTRSILIVAGFALLAATLATAAPALSAAPQTQCAPAAAMPAATTAVAFWSTEARCAIVPSAAGSENFGNKFPGDGAVYMGIVHAAIYDAAVAIDGGYRPYGDIRVNAPVGASPDAAIATAAHDTLVGLQPALGLTPPQQAILDADYDAYVGALADGRPKSDGIAVGRHVAAAILELRANDGRERNPTLADLNPPAPAPGVWAPNPAVTPGTPPPPVLGLRLPGIRPLVLETASQFRPGPPYALTSAQFAQDLRQVEALGRVESTVRTPEQTAEALFWTDHDLRTWNDGLLRLAAERRLSELQTARMLALAHVAGGDAMIACFDAKFHYWFWRPYQALSQLDPTWSPLRPTPNFPEYPSAHACHSGAVTQALRAFFGTDKVQLTLDSRVTGTIRTYHRLSDVVEDVNKARVLAGFHFWTSDLTGASLGRKVGRYIAGHFFQSRIPRGRPMPS
jgi:hypothetical protein